jgi:Domain of unknown function (DUF6438)/Ankyrin repeat
MKIRGWAVVGLAFAVGCGYIVRTQAWRFLIPFPTHVDRGQLEMRLERTGCFGTCPAYNVTVLGDGTVRYCGRAFVLISGAHVAHIQPEAVSQLLEDFRRAHFLAARSHYVYPATDLPTFVITLKIANREKVVVDYWGEKVGMPQAITSLEREFDQVADTSRWVGGDAETASAMDNEHWDFGAITEANVSLYDRAIEKKNLPLIGRFQSAGLNPLSRVDGTKVPVCVATKAGDPGLVRLMLPERLTIPREIATVCLGDAADARNLVLVQFWLAKGASTKTSPGEQGLLLRLVDNAPESEDLSALIATLAAAGANANEPDAMGWTPLFYADNPKTVKALVEAGANVNARNKLGYTALSVGAIKEPVVRELLANGADPSVVASTGDTALSLAQKFDCGPCVAAIQEAIRKRP